MSDKTCWAHADVFPVIFRLIAAAFRDRPDWVRHDELARRLLLDLEGRAIVETARNSSADPQPRAWYASNMVAWFSQQITVGRSDWSRTLERSRIDGAWAYRPLEHGHPSLGPSASPDEP